MGPVVLKILPLALGTIAPTMIGLVVLFLSNEKGLANAIAFILGKYLVYVLWGLLALDLADFLSYTSSASYTTISVIFFLIFGLLLVILAIRNFFGEDDPDAPPPKFMTILDKLGPTRLFGLGIAVSLMQPRFIILVLAGASIIAEARLPSTETFISILILALLMVWATLIPVVVFLVMGKRRAAAMKSMRTWLITHQHKINVAVMGFFGILMIILGLTRIF
jgi:threonine/homoserine/homoserine lactone efflux protein